MIRDATADDADAIAALTLAVYVGEGHTDPATSPEHVAELTDVAARLAECEVLVAEQDGRIVGTVTVAAPGSRSAHIAQPGEREVRMLAVDPSARRLGVAARLMAEVEARARRSGAQAVVLSTEPAMAAAHRLYEGRGYRRTPERDWSTEGVGLLTYRLAL